MANKKKRYLVEVRNPITLDAITSFPFPPFTKRVRFMSRIGYAADTSAWEYLI